MAGLSLPFDLRPLSFSEAEIVETQLFYTQQRDDNGPNFRVWFHDNNGLYPSATA